MPPPHDLRCENLFVTPSEYLSPVKSGSARSSTNSMGLTCFCSTKFRAAVREVKISSSEMSNSSFFNLSSRSCLLSLVVLVTNLTITEAARNLEKTDREWRGALASWAIYNTAYFFFFNNRPTFTNCLHSMGSASPPKAGMLNFESYVHFCEAFWAPAALCCGV